MSLPHLQRYHGGSKGAERNTKTPCPNDYLKDYQEFFLTAGARMGAILL